MTDIDLTEFERELLERASIGGARFGVALDCLDEELLEYSPGPEAIDVGLQTIQERGLVRGERSSGSLAPWFAWRFRRGKRALPNRARD
jgi:hypothetical protein